MRKIVFTNIIIKVLFLSVSLSNDIEIKNVSIISQNIEQAYSYIRFDIKWHNSWRYDYTSGINNWDAAWVFAKFRIGVSDPVMTGVNSNGNIITVNSTEGLRVGMILMKTAGAGVFRANTVIVSINSPTSFTVSDSPILPLEDATIIAIRIWEHAYLDSMGHLPGSWHGDGSGQAIIDIGLWKVDSPFNINDNPAVGAFIYRSEPGHGLFKSQGVQLRWNYGAHDLSADEIVDIKVFAIEMVYVPAGSFYLGSGGNETSAFYKQSEEKKPYKITSEGAIEIGSSEGMLFYDESPNAGDQSGPVPESFPKGYAAFYCMKYSVSQKQYVDFLNTLMRPQQGPRFAGRIVGAFMFDSFFSGSTTPQHRNGVRLISNPIAPELRVFGNDLNNNNIVGEADDGQNIAMNIVYFRDAAAFADWAGMRPMTELEYEKAARGNRYPVPDGFAWGTDQIAGSESLADGYLLNNDGTKTESSTYIGDITTYQGNAVWQGTARPDYSVATFDGPVRVGLFADNNTNRVQSGASFWGIMELSGNLCETVVSISNEHGRAFAGNHGDGRINISGNTDEISWPFSPNGAGIRGGSFFHDKELLRISDRSQALIDPFYRRVHTSFRVVRSRGCSSPATAPALIEGSNEATPGTIQNYSSSGGTNFLWIIPDGWEIITGQGTNSIEVYVGQYPGTIRAALINDCGAGPEQTKTISIY